MGTVGSTSNSGSGTTMRKVTEALENPGFKISADPPHSALGFIQFSLPKTTFVLD